MPTKRSVSEMSLVAPAHQVAGVAAVVESERQVLDAVVKMVAQVVGDAVGQPFAVETLAKSGQTAHQGDAQDDAAGGEQGRRFPGGQAVINGLFDDLGDEEVEQGGEENGRIGQQNLPPVRFQITQQPPVNGWLFLHKSPHQINKTPFIIDSPQRPCPPSCPRFQDD